MKVRYIGPHDGVYLPLPDGGEALVERDGELEVPDELGARLLEQASNWAATAPPPADKKRPARAATETAQAPADGDDEEA